MKLKNKLLPLVGVATACAAVAPIALTSCKNNADGFVDLLKLYKPTIDMHCQGKDGNKVLTKAEANKAYFGDATDGWTDDETIQERIKQDYYWSKSLAAWIVKSYPTSPLDGEAKLADETNIYWYNGLKKTVYNKLNSKINYVKVGHETVIDLTAGNLVFPTLSMQIEYEQEIDLSGIGTLAKVASSSTTSLSYADSVSYKGMVTITNLPICIDVYTNSTDRMWHIQPDWKEITNEFDPDEGLPTRLTTIPFTFTDEYTCKGVLTSETDTTDTQEYSVSKSHSYYASLMEEEDKIAEFKAYFNGEFAKSIKQAPKLGEESTQSYYDEFAHGNNYNFASYYLYGNGVKAEIA